MEYEEAAKLLSQRASELDNFRLLKTAWQKVAIAQRRWTDCEASLGGTPEISIDPGAIEIRLEQIENQIAKCVSARTRLKQRKDEHILIRPGIFARWFGAKSYHEWSSQMREFLDRADKNEDRLDGLNHCREALIDFIATLRSWESVPDRRKYNNPEQLDRAIEESRLGLAARKRDLEKLKAAIDHLKEQRTTLESDLADAQVARASQSEQLASLPPGLGVSAESMFGDDQNEREKSAPWFDEELQHLRANCFGAALALHEAFIVENENRFRDNLGLWIDVYDRGLSRNQFGKALQDLWETLFLVVPVISTAFASVGRMFLGTSLESIGWLFVDEAGQCTPQMAVGALWRSRRAIIVGDPLQLEPIMPLPNSILKTLADTYRIDSPWYQPNNSVQHVADLANPIGTHLNPENSEHPTTEREAADGSDLNGGVGERLWVRSPLRVHRRCQSLMFRVANQIAYGGLMVYGTKPSEGAIMELPENAWIDLASSSTSAIEHWIPEHGEVAATLLAHLLNQFGNARSPGGENHVFVLSPFKSVARKFKKLVESLKNFDREEMLGTIHTFQGKESDVVILLLGCNPQRAGAIPFFAAAKPNLLNVAVTRAKHRLYVIGDRALWARASYFKTLDCEISTVNSKEFLARFGPDQRPRAQLEQ
jgi:hypothetical protein